MWISKQILHNSLLLTMRLLLKDSSPSLKIQMQTFCVSRKTA